MGIGMGPESNPQNIGPTALDSMYRALGIDAEWCLRADRNIAWWPHTYRQSLIADPPYKDDAGTTRTPITCSTEALQAMPESPALYEMLSLINDYASLSSVVFDPATREIRCSSRVYVQSADSWLVTTLQAAAGIQLARVANLGPRWVELGGRLAESAHPESGLRANPDDLVNGAHNLFARDGHVDSPFSGLLPGIDAHGDHQWSTLNCSANRLVAEVPFRDLVPMSALARNEPAATKAVLQVTTDEKHAELGYGLAGQLELPLPGDAATGHMMANTCNLLESQGKVVLTQFLGAWNFKRTLGFRFFIPALIGRNHDAPWRAQLIHTFLEYLVHRAANAYLILETARIRVHRRHPELSDLEYGVRITRDPS